MKISQWILPFLLLICFLFTSVKHSPAQDGISILNRFENISTSDSHVFKFVRNGFSKPSGGHLQGIQQLDERHLIISGSSKKNAYFFIVQWKTKIGAREKGRIIQLVNINEDFPDMKHNHAGGIQVMGNILAIGTELSLIHI